MSIVACSDDEEPEPAEVFARSDARRASRDEQMLADALQQFRSYLQKGNIDAALFPQTARLAADATWYRNATTVHGFTGGDPKNRLYEMIQRRVMRRPPFVVRTFGTLRVGFLGLCVTAEGITRDTLERGFLTLRATYTTSRISVDGMRSVTYSPSLATSCTAMPAERPTLPP